VAKGIKDNCWGRACDLRGISKVSNALCRVDHTQYDATSFLRFLTRRFDLPILPGLAARDEALRANGHPPMGDLTNALAF
jgi:phospholipase C